MNSTYNQFKTEINRLSNGERKIAVAVSGGSDSMALAVLCDEYAKETGISVIAITVDHRLRPESADEARQVTKWLAKLGIEHHILCWEGDKKSSNIQAEARNARYKLMADFCAQNNIKSLYIAHTSEDQAETVLMRLMRGSGVDGLAGIAETSEVFGIKVIRPLLKLKREELRGYLRGNTQEWVEDPSNENTKFTRVQVRNLIKSSDEPELLTKRLADTASHMARAKGYIEERIRERIADIFIFHAAGFYTIDIQKFRILHDEERLRSLAAALQHVGGQIYRPRFENLVALDNQIISGNIGTGCTLWGCEITISKKHGKENILFVYREAALISADIEVLTNSKTLWDGRFVCEIGNIDVRGLKVGALGKDGYSEVNQIDKSGKLLELHCNIPSCGDLGKVVVPKKIIYTLPILKTLEKVLAVPHIGYYINEKVRMAFFSEISIPPGLFKN